MGSAVDATNRPTNDTFKQQKHNNQPKSKGESLPPPVDTEGTAFSFGQRIQ